jgi:hypothetical protein
MLKQAPPSLWKVGAGLPDLGSGVTITPLPLPMTFCPEKKSTATVDWVRWQDADAATLIGWIKARMPTTSEASSWVANAQALLERLTPVLVHLRQQGAITLSAQTMQGWLALDRIQKLCQRSDVPENLLAPLRQYVKNLPDFTTWQRLAEDEKPFAPAQEHHSFLAMQLNHALRQSVLPQKDPLSTLRQALLADPDALMFGELPRHPHLLRAHLRDGMWRRSGQVQTNGASLSTRLESVAHDLLDAQQGKGLV